MSPVKELVIRQIKNAFMYLPAGCIWAAGIILILSALYLILSLFFHYKIKPSACYHFGLLYLLIIYVYCILQLTILSRTPADYGGIDWNFLSRWNVSDFEKSCYIANAIMFVPFGILLPMFGKWLQHILTALPIAIFCSIGIETIQLKYQLGFCQLDDALTNTTGFLIGFLMYLALADVVCFFRWLRSIIS